MINAPKRSFVFLFLVGFFLSFGVLWRVELCVFENILEKIILHTKKTGIDFSYRRISFSGFPQKFTCRLEGIRIKKHPYFKVKLPVVTVKAGLFFLFFLKRLHVSLEESFEGTWRNTRFSVFHGESKIFLKKLCWHTIALQSPCVLVHLDDRPFVQTKKFFLHINQLEQKTGRGFFLKSTVWFDHWFQKEPFRSLESASVAFTVPSFFVSSPWFVSHARLTGKTFLIESTNPLQIQDNIIVGHTLLRMRNGYDFLRLLFENRIISLPFFSLLQTLFVRGIPLDKEHFLTLPLTITPHHILIFEIVWPLHKLQSLQGEKNCLHTPWGY